MEKVSEKNTILKISYPDNQLTKELINPDNINRQENHLIKTTKNDSVKYLLNNRADLALLTPLDYGLAQKSGDIRILGSPVLFLQDYTEMFGIEFKPGIQEIKTVGSDIPDAFILGVAKILFSERYGLNLEDFIVDNKDPDVMIKYKAETVSDIGEDWFETFRFPLPLYVWCLRAEETEHDIEKINKVINDLCIDLSKEIQSDDGHRVGKISFVWDENYEKAFDDTLETMFYHGILPEIFASKKYGEDIISEE